MQCYEVTEEVRLGLPVVRDVEVIPGVMDAVDGLPAVQFSRPRIETPPGCLRLLIEDSLARRLQEEPPPGAMRYGVACNNVWRAGQRVPIYSAGHMDIEIDEKHVLFKRPTYKTDRLALVELHIRAGEGGKVRLTSDGFAPVLHEHQKSVRREYRGFPDAGLEALVTEVDMLKAVNEGVELLQLFVKMCPGACFHIVRSGHLEGAPSRMRVFWNGYQLDVRSSGRRAQQPPASRRQARAGGALAAAAE
jgi:hypothetical protein